MFSMSALLRECAGVMPVPTGALPTGQYAARMGSPNLVDHPLAAEADPTRATPAESAHHACSGSAAREAGRMLAAAGELRRL
jgi:hypothetical protein